MHSSDNIQTMEGPLLGRRKEGEKDILIYMKSGSHIWEKRETGHRSTLSLWMIRKGDLQERADNSDTLEVMAIRDAPFQERNMEWNVTQWFKGRSLKGI